VHKAHTYKTPTVAVGLIPLLLFLTTSCQQTQALNKNKTASSKVAIKLERVIPPVKIPSGKENIRYGFIDRSGQFVIEPKFLGASCFKGGLASVITDKGYAYIDKSGRFVTPPGEYIAYHGGNCDDTWPNYAEGLYRVKQIFRVSGTKDDDTKSFAGYVNAQGKLVISLAPYYADDFSDGMARRKNKKRANDAVILHVRRNMATLIPQAKSLFRLSLIEPKTFGRVSPAWVLSALK
jgi:WG containing repeat